MLTFFDITYLYLDLHLNAKNVAEKEIWNEKNAEALKLGDVYLSPFLPSWVG